jgi:membrane fusion protein (multidrug efflux system)
MIDMREIRELARRRRPDIVVGLILGLIALVAIALTINYLFRTSQIIARDVGLPVPVQTVPAKVRSVDELIGGSGVIEQIATVMITARVVSKVLRVPVDVGSVVRKGDTLAELDDRFYRAKLEAAKVDQDHTGNQLDRMIALEKKGYGAPADTEKARVAAAEAKQAVVQAEIDLANTQITSPIGAIVLERKVNPGDTPALGNSAFILGAIEQVWMAAQVDEEKIGSVQLGLHGEVSTVAFPGVIFSGEVTKIDGRVDKTTRTFGAYIKIENEDLRLRPGVYGYATLKNQHKVLAVPSTAVMNPVGDRATVFVVDKEKRAHLRKIRRGLMIGGMTELLEGVQEGESVVTVGQLELRDNDRVRVNESAPWNR